VAADTITGAELNTYLRDNLLAEKAHHDANSGVHGIDAANYVMGCWAHHHRIEGHRSAEQSGAGGKDVNFTWDIAYASPPLVLHSIEYISGDATVPLDICLTAVSETGCTLHFSVTGDGHWRGHVIAIGSDS
jgi:hypothetical protein